MRRWQLSLALTLALVLMAPAAEAVVSPEEGSSAIVSGVLTDTAGAAVPGNVEVFAWPTGRPVQVGQSIQLTPVGYDRAAKDGRFSVLGDLSPQLADLAAANGGYVNFVLQAASGGAVEELHFSRFVGEAAFAAQEANSGRRNRPVEWRASPDEAAEAVHVRLPEAHEADGAPEDRPIRPMQGGCYGLTLIDSQIGYTVIGELRAPQDTREALFAYGKRADSEIGVAARGAQGPWEMSGSFHIANGEETGVTQGADSGQHLLVTTRFKYDRYEYFCAAGRREKIVPSEWMGDVQSQPTAVRGCAGAPEDRLGRYAAKTGFDRIREKAVRWEGAVSVFGASLDSRSGYSEWVQGHWKFGPDGMHLLCGDNGPPKRAGHIFAGTSA